MNKLTAAIITLNEEKNIARCIESVKDIADEILVVDSFSTDRTQEIAKSLGAKFVQNPFAGYIEQKNFALQTASHDFVLSLDADEALDEKAQSELKEIKQNLPEHGVMFPRLTFYGNRPVRHCGWYPDRKLRLVNKHLAKWRGVNPHDILENNNKAHPHQLRGNILHYSYESISDHIRQTNSFTTVAAKTLFRQGRKTSLFELTTRPLWKFFHDYIIKRGFLDGRLGFVICSINALYALLKYAKLYELQEGRSIEES